MGRITKRQCNFFNRSKKFDPDVLNTINFIDLIYEELKKYENFMEKHGFENLEKLEGAVRSGKKTNS